MKKLFYYFLLVAALSLLMSSASAEELNMKKSINKVKLNDTNTTDEINETINLTNQTYNLGNETINISINHTGEANTTDEIINTTNVTLPEVIDEETNHTNITEEVNEEVISHSSSSWPENVPTGAYVEEATIITSNPQITTYVKVNGNLIATKDSEMKYYHNDFLGSPRITSKDSRTYENENTYSPYGKKISGKTTSGTGYTGHLFNSHSGLVYAGARYYNPELRIWTTPDPVIRTDTSAYAYVANNPLNYVDPDGRDSNKPNRYKYATDPFDRKYIDHARKIDSNARLVEEKVGGTASFSFSLKIGSFSVGVSLGNTVDSEEGYTETGELTADINQVGVSVDTEEEAGGSVSFDLLTVSGSKTDTEGELSVNAMGFGGIKFSAAGVEGDSTDFTQKVTVGPKKKGSVKLGPINAKGSAKLHVFHELTQRKANKEDTEE